LLEASSRHYCGGLSSESREFINQIPKDFEFSCSVFDLYDSTKNPNVWNNLVQMRIILRISLLTQEFESFSPWVYSVIKVILSPRLNMIQVKLLLSSPRHWLPKNIIKWQHFVPLSTSTQTLYFVILDSLLPFPTCKLNCEDKCQCGYTRPITHADTKPCSHLKQTYTLLVWITWGTIPPTTFFRVIYNIQTLQS
jgi:hypothetical protein